jgi:uncharacterized protein (TIRG00374 family)
LKSFSFLIGLALFAFLLSRIELTETWRILRTVDLRWFLPAFLFAVPEVFFKSLRLRAFVTKASSHITLPHSIWAFLSGQPLSALTPGKLGDVTRILMIGRYSKLSMPTALAVHAADRVYDLAAVLLLSIIGLVSLLGGDQEHGPALSAILGVAAGMLFILAFLNPRWLKFTLKPLVFGLLSKKLAERLSHPGKEFFDRFRSLIIPSFRPFGPFVLSFLAWETAILRAYLFLLLAPVMIMVELIPVSVLGFGTREAAMFLLFTSDQLPQEALLAFSLLIVLAGPLFVSLIGIPAATQLIPSFKDHNAKNGL